MYRLTRDEFKKRLGTLAGDEAVKSRLLAEYDAVILELERLENGAGYQPKPGSPGPKHPQTGGTNVAR